MDANIRFDHQLLAVETEHEVHGLLELHVPDPATSRTPLHLALVIDKSGSMGGPKLAAARDAGSFLAQRLQPDDSLAVVAFDDEVELVAPLAPVGPGTLAAIDGIVTGGSTNLSGGWLKGLEELGRAGEGVRRVLLLTDGMANVGIVDPGQLASLAAGTKAQAATTTIGFGDGFDEDLLATIADGSGGATYFAETPDAAAGIFAEEFEGLTTLVAQNVSIEVRPTDAVQLLGVLNEYPTVEVPGGVQVQLGDAYGGERRRIVFRLAIPHLAALGPARVADVVLRYVSVGDQVAQHETTIPVVVNLVSADEAAAATVDQEVVEEVTLLEAARARREAIRHADDGDVARSRSAIDHALGEVELKLACMPDSEELAAEARRLRQHQGDLLAGLMSATTRKRLHNESWRRSRGRDQT